MLALIEQWLLLQKQQMPAMQLLQTLPAKALMRKLCSNICILGSSGFYAIALAFGYVSCFAYKADAAAGASFCFMLFHGSIFLKYCSATVPLNTLAIS
jgi:hypothetical protein